MAIRANRKMLRHTYSWKALAGDDPLKTRIDARFFNRSEGYEVVRMINRLTKHFDFDSEDDVHRIEELIKSELPGNVRGRKRVFNWLVAELETAAEEPDDDDVVAEYFERIARHLVGSYEQNDGSIPRRLDETVGGYWSDNPTVEVDVHSFERDEHADPPVDSYEGRVSFRTEDRTVRFSLDFNFSGEDIQGSTYLGEAD